MYIIQQYLCENFQGLVRSPTPRQPVSLPWITSHESWHRDVRRSDPGHSVAIVHLLLLRFLDLVQMSQILPKVSIIITDYNGFEYVMMYHRASYFDCFGRGRLVGTQSSQAHGDSTSTAPRMQCSPYRRHDDSHSVTRRRCVISGFSTLLFVPPQVASAKVDARCQTQQSEDPPRSSGKHRTTAGDASKHKDDSKDLNNSSTKRRRILRLENTLRTRSLVDSMWKSLE